MKKIYLAIPLLLLGCTDSDFNYPASEKKPLSYDAHDVTCLLYTSPSPRDS